MNTLKFKTSINCSSCVAKVTPVLNNHEEIETWKVDTENPEKILTVEGNELNAQDIIKSLKKIGFSAETI